MKKIKLTLEEMISFVDNHSSWLSPFQKEWFDKIKEYYFEKKHLSQKQRKIILKYAGQIMGRFRHDDFVNNTKRLNYQRHNFKVSRVKIYKGSD